MMMRSHCYWVSKIIIISFSLIYNVLTSATPHICHHDQRDALLEFIDEFPIDESTLSFWEMENYNDWTSSWNNSTDCCVWKGVTCDDNSGQVISLDLSLTFLNGSLKTNSSLFKHQYLRNLNLMECHLTGKIPSSLGNLSRLTSIDLSSNKLVGEIPDSIGNLNQLISLSLEFNGLIGMIPSSIGNLNQLRSFSLEYNNLTGQIPFSLGNLSHLLELTLYVNHLVGEVPVSIGNLNELVTLSLFRNMLSGNIPVLLVNLTKISQFSLYSNNFTSMLPSNMSAFHNLEYIDVRENSFHGSIPKSLFLNPLLRKVSLSRNQFTGPIEFGNMSSSSELKYLYLDRNRFSGPIPDSISEFLNIQILDLSHNNFSGAIPTSISKLVNLISLGLSNNTLEGRVPSCLSQIYSLRLSHNSFSIFENSSHETKIQVLDLSSNSFREPFPLWTCNFKLLEFLDLSNNLFNGLIPSCLRNMADSLGELILHNNNFSGTLPDIFVNATKLQYLDVSHNQLEGKLPKSLINCKYLELLNVEGNIIKDNFPSWLASLPSLHVLILKSNDFFGPLYYRHIFSGFQSLRIIDISHNGFTGSLPPNYFANWNEMTTLMSETNEYMMDYGTYRYYSVYQYQSMEMVNKGVEMRFERIRKDWRAIDFSGNRFYGKIPESIGLLKELRLLNLSGNTFRSDIPQRLANLTNLETLDLSCNKLTGQIPQDLGKLSSLSYMNFSHNNLQGIVPRGTQFQRQECSSFSDNPRLHGLEEICGKAHILNPSLHQPEEFSETEEHIFNWIAAAIAYGPGVFSGLVFGHIFTSHYHEWFADKFGGRKPTIAS